MLSVIITAIIAISIYITLHEFGHSLIAVACGAHITKFSIINARMSYEGANFTHVTEALFNVFGVILPLLIAAVSLCFYKRNAKKMIYHIGYSFFAMISTASALQWVIIPIVALLSQPPAGDDVTKLMFSSSLPPLAIATGALIIVLLMIIWMFSKGIPSAFVQVIKTVQKDKT